MTRDDVIKLAEAAGFRSAVMLDRLGTEAALCEFEVEELARLEHFAALVAAAEREACAKVCNSFGDECNSVDSWYIAHSCAAAIRARSTTE